MRQAPSILAFLLVVSTLVACTEPLPPPPVLKVTSPQRGLVQSDAGRIVVQGSALPGPSGDPVNAVKVNGVAAKLAADGSFTAVVDLPPGAMLLETVATSNAGASITDARAVQVGQLRPIGAGVDRAVTAALSADAFTRLAAAAGPIIKTTDLSALLAPLQPMANLGDDFANLKLSITKLTIGDAKITLTPTDGGLTFSAELDALDVAANAAYGGALVPDGTTSVGITADKVTIGGTLVVTPAGTAGFTTTLASPIVRTTNLRLQASGLVGRLFDLLNSQLASTIERVATRSAELALDPLIDSAFGALAGPQRLNVLGRMLNVQASPSAVTFSRAGALVTMNLQILIDGAESSPGYMFTPNGTPAITMTSGIQLGLADDLVNQLLAQIHALGLLNLQLKQDFGVFDTADFKLAMPPMIGAHNGDGSLRLVLGDMVATFTDDGKHVIGAAVNAQVDLEILRGAQPQAIALKFGKVQLFVNVLGDPNDLAGEDLFGAATAGLNLQLDSLSQFLITLPVPSVAGVSFDSLSVRGDSGYVVVSGQIH